MDLHRTQVLLTKDLNKQIKKISTKQGVSQSEVVRKLLTQSLNKSKHSARTSAIETSNKYLYSSDEFHKDNPRTNGFRELYSVGGKTIEIQIAGHETFEYYLKHKKFSTAFEMKVLKEVYIMQKLSETGKLVVRRAYVVPGLDNPPGPRFIGLQPEDVLAAIKQLYDFAIEHEYHTSKGSQICIFFYPFVDPKPLDIPVKQSAILPYGGYAVPLNQKASRVEVLAVWGNNEGVQSFDNIDRYTVDTTKMVILEKNIPQKLEMFATTTQDQDRITVPVNKQFQQVLNDLEILETGRIVKELSQRYGLRRVEFSFDGKENLIYNETAPYKIEDQTFGEFQMRGSVTIVRKEQDISRLQDISDSKVKNTILLIDKKIIEERSYDLLNQLAGLSKKFTVLYPGLSATAHAMRLLSDFGHRAIVVGNRQFSDGEELFIQVEKDRQIQIQKTSDPEWSKLAVNLHDTKLFGQKLVGGKAHNLSLMKSKGFRVPHGFVLTTKFFDSVLEKVLNKQELDLLSKTNTVDPKMVRKLRNTNFLEDTPSWEQIVKRLKIDPNKKYAVRSSATVEDQIDHSFAGQFKTFLNVEFNDLQKNVSEVIRSTFDKQVLKYFSALGKPPQLKMAVVIQEMVDAEKAGVIFGKDIQTENEDHIIIDVAQGLGNGVVDGTVKTQRFIYSRSKNTLLNKSMDKKKKFISKFEIDALLEMTRSLEHQMGRTQDIEWAIDNAGCIWLVQTRPI